MRLWGCFHRPMVFGEDDVSTGNCSTAEKTDTLADPSAMETGLGYPTMAPCKRSPQYRAHQALAPCLQQLPLHTLQRLYQPASHQQLQKMQLIDCKLLDGHFFIAFDELVFHQMIGQGSFKSVFRGRWRNTNVAIVRMRKGGLLTEARLMQKLSTHPNLVQFYRWSRDTHGNEYIVLELVPLGSLNKVLLRFGEVLRMRIKLSTAEQVAAAMAELHKEGVLHRDLAARNVLVQSLDPVHVKVADFGLAHRQDSNCQCSSSNSSSSSHSSAVWQLDSLPVRWCAPEVISHQAWGPASDVWAFGVTLWEIFANGAEPYAMHNDAKVAEVVLSGGRLPRPARCPREVYGLMMQCWATDPDHRPTFDKILATFSQWRQEHAQQSQAAQQLHTCVLTTLEAPPSMAQGGKPLRHAQSWTPQQAAATPFCNIGSDSSAHSGVCAAPAFGSQLPAGASPGNDALELVHTAGVYRSLSEPLPSWDLNKQAKALLRANDIPPCQHQPGHKHTSCQPLCTSTCCRPASLGASCSHRGNCSSSSAEVCNSNVPQQPCIEDPATAPEVAAQAYTGAAGLTSGSESDVRGRHNSCGLVYCSALGMPCLDTQHSLIACSPAACATGDDGQHQRLPGGQQPGQPLSCVCLPQPSGSGSCFHYQTYGVWSPWVVNAVGQAEGPVKVASALHGVHHSVEMSFDLEGMIDPNDSTFLEPQELASICGSWDPLITAGKTWSCSSGSSSVPLIGRHVQCGLQTTALYGNARDLTQVKDHQYLESYHQAHTMAANLGNIGLGATARVELPNTSAAAVWCGGSNKRLYVDVRSVVYGGQELAC